MTEETKEPKEPKRVKLVEIFSAEYVRGMQAAFRIAEEVARKNNVTIKFPNVHELQVQKHIEKPENYPAQSENPDVKGKEEQEAKKLFEERKEDRQTKGELP